MTEEEYIKQRIDDQIDWYSKKSASCHTKHNTLKFVEIFAATLIPFLSGMGPQIPYGPWIIGIMGVIIALGSAAGSLFKFHENWIQYRATSEQLKHEKFLFITLSGPYTNDDRFRTLVERIEGLISTETATWTQIVKQDPKVSQGIQASS